MAFLITGSQGLPTVATLAKPAPTTHTQTQTYPPYAMHTHTRAGFVIKFVYFLSLSSSRKKSPPPDHKSTTPPPTPSASISINSPALSPTLSPQFTTTSDRRSLLASVKFRSHSLTCTSARALSRRILFHSPARSLSLSLARADQRKALTHREQKRENPRWLLSPVCDKFSFCDDRKVSICENRCPRMRQTGSTWPSVCARNRTRTPLGRFSPVRISKLFPQLHLSLGQTFKTEFPSTCSPD